MTLLFNITDGLVVEPEAIHAIKASINFAIIYKANKEKITSIFVKNGHSPFDLSANDLCHYKQILDH